jgi:zinc D-Ala-D-Ala dipeptidase
MSQRLKPMLYLVSVLFVISSCTTGHHESCRPHDNPYGLNIIHCAEEYHEAVRDNPDFELVDLEEAIPGITLDIRYATANNFTKEVIYTAPKAFIRKPVADALRRAQDSLRALGFGLIVYDAYRPYAASVKFFEVYTDTNFVANPRQGSRHNRGCAVDVALEELSTGLPIPMPTPFDDFSMKAHPDYQDLPDTLLQNRALLFGIMQHFGFTHYPTEWWHFDFRGWENYPLMDLPFETLVRSEPTSINQ